MRRVRRREILSSLALLFTLLFTRVVAAKAGTVQGGLPWEPNAGSPPRKVEPGPWQFFNSDEATLVEAIADRIIPPDPEFAGGKDAGCAVYIDRQLAGPYGRREGLYTSGPFQHGSKAQGHQSADGPAEQYRSGLAAIATYCRERYGGKAFHELSPADQDKVLTEMESGKVALQGVDAKELFLLIVKDVQQGFFADPIYGGNRDMVSWRMIGYPGARYSYLDWVGRHNERFPLPPVGIAGRPDWVPKEG